MSARRCTFPKRARLRKRNDFLRVHREGRRHHTEHFVILVSEGRGAQARVGVTVSARVGGAVVRNRLKRLVREIVRRRWRALRRADIVVIAKPHAALVNHTAASAEILRALDRF